MAELSGFWTTGGATGDQQVSYTQAQWSTASKIMSACSGFEGVAPGYLNSLAGTVGGANTVAINTGGAMVDGKWFLNDASQNVNIPSASGGGNTRIDRIVLRADWANYNVSVYRIAGTDAGSPVVPSITQTSGTTYDIMLYQALVDTGGTVTLTDERVWASNPSIRRQGGSATVWGTAGTTNYHVGKYMMQVGVGTAVFLAENVDQETITFPVAFTYAPIGFCTALHGASGGEYFGAVHSTSTTELIVQIAPQDAGSKTETVYFTWMAIGPV